MFFIHILNSIVIEQHFDHTNVQNYFVHFSHNFFFQVYFIFTLYNFIDKDIWTLNNHMDEIPLETKRVRLNGISMKLNIIILLEF